MGFHRGVVTDHHQTRVRSSAHSTLAATDADTSSRTPRICLEVALVASMPSTGWLDPVAVLTLSSPNATAGVSPSRSRSRPRPRPGDGFGRKAELADDSDPAAACVIGQGPTRRSGPR